MNKYRKKTMATLLIATFILSMFAVAIPVSAEVYQDFEDQEVLWGCNPRIETLPDEDRLKIEVWYKGSKAYFRATIPECYDPETSLASFTFDVDGNTIADFQIQYIGEDLWVYSEVDETTTPKMLWVKDTSVGWLQVPSEFILTNKDRVFTLKLPMSLLSETYKFGFQANRQRECELCPTTHNTQIFYSTVAGELWYDSAYKDYVHSTYYVEMELPPLKSTLVPGHGNGLDKPLPNEDFAKGRQ